jgi:hypothetical protein
MWLQKRKTSAEAEGISGKTALSGVRVQRKRSLQSGVTNEENSEEVVTKAGRQGGDGQRE